ncbi:MAG: phosphate ABC transporter permease PstA [Spirochaetales bacterium]|nr:phosphate ABC transporter permease PstA [Spirochaetales bacterium]
MDVSNHTILSRKKEKAAKALLWTAVLLTLAILLGIILYIMVRGFVSRQEKSYFVSPFLEETLKSEETGEYAMKIIVHRQVKISDLTMEDLRTIYTKSRAENWGHYSMQDKRITALAPSRNTPLGKAAETLIAGPEGGFGSYVAYLEDDEEMIRRIAEDPAGIGIIEADTPVTNRKVKVVPVRRIVVAVHPSVKEIIDNRQLSVITEKELKLVLSGDITDWKDLGGHDRPIRLIRPPEAWGLDELVSPSDIPAADSPEDFFRMITDLPDSLGLCFYDDAAAGGLSILEVSRREVKGNLTLSFLLEPPARSGKWGGISTIILNTLFLILFTLLFAAPAGVLAAIYLVEYAKQGPLVSLLRRGTETLAGVPSIIFGLFGNIFFVNTLGLGIGFISSTLTVTMMILPTIIRTSEEALKAVPLSYREGSLALGASKLQTTFKVVLPAAVPGILTGLILALGRVVGETAVLLYTLGSNYELVRGPSSSARVLSLHLYFLFSEAISFDRAFATGAILVFIILLVNYSTTRLIGRAGRMSG